MLPTFDPDLNGGDLAIAGGEIVRVLGTESYGIYKIPTGGAFTRATESSTLVKTCANANSYTGIILLKVEDENKVYSDPSHS